MRHAAYLGAIAILFAGPVCAAESGSANGSLSDVIIADEIRTAFYVHATRSMTSAISKAVNAWCASKPVGRADGETPGAETVAWLCQADKRVYFGNVYVTGSKGPHALVCENNGTSELKYFGVDLAEELLSDGACISAEFDGVKYELYFREKNGDGDG